MTGPYVARSRHVGLLVWFGLVWFVQCPVSKCPLSTVHPQNVRTEGIILSLHSGFLTDTKTRYHTAVVLRTLYGDIFYVEAIWFWFGLIHTCTVQSVLRVCSDHSVATEPSIQRSTENYKLTMSTECSVLRTPYSVLLLRTLLSRF